MKFSLESTYRRSDAALLADYHYIMDLLEPSDPS